MRTSLLGQVPGAGSHRRHYHLGSWQDCQRQTWNQETNSWRWQSSNEWTTQTSFSSPKRPSRKRVSSDDVRLGPKTMPESHALAIPQLVQGLRCGREEVHHRIDQVWVDYSFPTKRVARTSALVLDAASSTVKSRAEKDKEPADQLGPRASDHGHATDNQGSSQRGHCRAMWTEDGLADSGSDRGSERKSSQPAALLFTTEQHNNEELEHDHSAVANTIGRHIPRVHTLQTN